MVSKWLLKTTTSTAVAGALALACSSESVNLPIVPDAASTGAPDPATPEPGEPDPSSPEPPQPSVKDAGTPRDAGKDATADSCTPTRWYRDADGDGSGAAATFTDACVQPPGHVADKSDCDDTKASIKPGAPELCDAVDSDCDGNVNGAAAEAAACSAKAGAYAGTYTLYTAEKLGATIINEMRCTGTTTLTFDLSAAAVVTGTVTCSYPGSLGGFTKTQTGTLQASVRLDGTVEGSVEHAFDGFTKHTVPLKGKAENGRIDLTADTTWKPHPMSAVPWQLTVTLAAPKN